MRRLIGNPRFDPVLVACGALAVRLIYIGQMVSTPIFHGLALDSLLYDRLARQIAGGNWGHKDSILLSEFYQFFLAAVYSLFGPNQLAVVLLQALLDAGSCALLCRVAARTYGRPVGLAAGIIYAFYGIAIFYSGLLLDTTVAVFLQLAFISLFIRGLDRSPGAMEAASYRPGGRPAESSPPARPRTLPGSDGALFFFLSGLTYGLLTTSRPNFILFLPFLLPFALFFLRDETGRHRPLKIPALFAAGAVIVLSAATWRHAVHFDALSPFPAHGGFNFYIGNNPQSKGTFMSPPGVSRSPGTQVKDSIRLASRRSGRDLTPYEASRYWLAQGLDYFTRRPLDAAALLAKKTALFFRKEEIRNNIDYVQSKPFIPLFALPFFSFGLIAPLCLIGVFLPLGAAKDHAGRSGALRSEGEAVFPGRGPAPAGHAFLLFYFAAGTASIVLFFISDRYRLPMVPIAILFASRAAIELVRAAIRRKVKKFALLFLPAALLFFLVNYNFAGLAGRSETVIHYLNLATTLIRQNEKESALEYLKKAVAIDPGAAAALGSLGRLLIEMGDLESGERQLQKALAIDPLDAAAHLNMGIALEKRGDMEAAENRYRTALDISPSLVEARVKLARRLMAAGDLSAAHAEFRAALAEEPDFEPAYEGLGEVLAESGDFEAAVRFFSDIVKRHPVRYAAHVNAGVALKKAGRPAAAAVHFQKAADLDPGRYEAFFQLGSIHSARGEGEAAMALFRKAIAADPGSYEAHLKVGIEYAKRGEMAPAVAVFRRAVDLAPGSAEARRNLVRAYLASGDLPAARKEYEALLEKMPQAAKPLEKYFPAVPAP